MSDIYAPYMCTECDEWHPHLTEQCPNVQTHEGEEEINSDGEQNFDWGEDGVQQNWDEETEDFDHYYGDDIVVEDFSDDGLGDVETSFSTIDLDSEEDEDLDFVEEEEIKRKRMSDGEGPQFKRPKQLKMKRRKKIPMVSRILTGEMRVINKILETKP
ncbi:uncharacterized protein LOC124207053 [Daphnia pulex]|uniref:uncharacterized protein LOC124207053 n=1 Tax=Daphnia pulex TaxID=6669 RepID=UPI001EDF6D4E|nr:uncharacterized protein LOC124207053 [Daphnia pulex]